MFRFSNEQKEFYLKKAKALCAEHDATLLYLTFFGSTLYGTESEGKSDVDIRGVFLPNPKSLYLNNARDSIRYTSGDETSKNKANDVDIDLWSIQKWLLELLKNGDIGAIDLLFSDTYKECTIYYDDRLSRISSNKFYLVNINNGRSYAAYSLRHAQKYGIKGSRLRVFQNIENWISNVYPQIPQDIYLKDVIDDIILACDDNKYCVKDTKEGENVLVLCGKVHFGHIRLSDFLKRVKGEIDQYGSRSKTAQEKEGVDFKAFSHAIRVLDQLKMFYQEVGISFPLSTRDELRDIKEGKFSLQELNEKMEQRFADVDEARKKAYPPYWYSEDFAKSCILYLYGIKSPQSISSRWRLGEIKEDVAKAINERLDALEKEREIRILYACESGSRAWGFPSKDSDYDVRFIYVHKPEWYLDLGLVKKRDVIELGIEKTEFGELDINGWELQKALKLFGNANPQIIEWTTSSIVYRERGNLLSHLYSQLRSEFPSNKMWYHYRSWMLKQKEYYSSQKHSIKAWFYILRPLLAMKWIEKGLGVPPMRIQCVMKEVLDFDLCDTIDQMIEFKSSEKEGQNFDPPSRLMEYVESEIIKCQATPPIFNVVSPKHDFSRLFQELLRDAW